MKHRELIVLVIAVLCFGSRANDVSCTLCETVVNDVFNAAQKLHNDNVNHPQLLQDICNQIYTQSRCQVEFKPILDHIAVSMSSGHTIAANSICAALKLCKATTTVSNAYSENQTNNNNKRSFSQEPKTDLGCSICNGVIAKLKKLVGFSSSKTLIQKSLGSICQQVQVVSWCDKALLANLDIITDSISMDDSPSETCSKAKICSPASTAPFFGIPRDTCLMCQNTIQRVEMAVTFFGHTPESTGMNELICRDPGFKDKCTQTILPNLGTIVTDLVLGEQSSTICSKLNLCLEAPPNTDEISAAFEEIPQLKCSSCQAVVHTLKVSLQGNTSDAKMQQGLRNLCTITPLKGTCSALKTLFTERALDIRSEVHHICEGAKYCDPIPASAQTCRSVDQFSPPLTRSLPFMNEGVGTPSPIFGLDAGCQACQWLASAVEAYLSQESTEEELARVLQELCTALPPEYAKVCQNFVSVYLSEALVYLLDKVTPPFICSKLLQCL